jgi:hypothetical protein
MRAKCQTRAGQSMEFISLRSLLESNATIQCRLFLSVYQNLSVSVGEKENIVKER